MAKQYCDHGVHLDKVCDQCVADIKAQQPEPQKAKADHFEMFMVRNAIVEAMDAIVPFENFHDPKRGKRPDGKSVFLLLLAMAKYVWKPVGSVWAGDKALAHSTGLSVDYIRSLKRAAVHAGLLQATGRKHHKTRTDIYVMSIDLIAEFVQRAVLPTPAVLKDLKHDPKGDALEEAHSFQVDDLDGEDQTEQDATMVDPHAEPIPDPESAAARRRTLWGTDGKGRSGGE